MALIDLSIVERLIAAQLNTVGGGVVALFRGDAIPADDAALAGGDGVERTADFLGVKLMPLAGQRSNAGLEGDEPEHADFVAAVNCSASAAQQAVSNMAITNVVTHVARVLAGRTLRDAATGHQVDILACERSVDADSDRQDDDQWIATGVVVVSGVVCRTGGAGSASVESH